MIDSHCHLNHPEFASDVDQVIARARQAGITGMVVVGYDLPSSRRALALCAHHRGLACTVGISPHDAGTFSEEAYAQLTALAREPGVVAIGEIGLEYHWRPHPPALQREVFRRQLALAVECGLPAVVHNREADDETMEVLASVPGVRAVLHCFSGTAAMAREAADRGWLVGVAGNVTFKNALDLQAVVSALPPESTLVETDCPYLAPVPHRGRRNEPAWLPHVVDKVATLWGKAPAEVAGLTAANARACFGLAE